MEELLEPTMDGLIGESGKIGSITDQGAGRRRSYSLAALVT
jgi:hypothetical protein